ncbi:Uncharacterised protein [Candidatus Gugararchaeum adminiculabundum]|nr:Uncharacterised protein [Candidatus Gugararchaeum adminiculabundum]
MAVSVKTITLTKACHSSGRALRRKFTELDLCPVWQGEMHKTATFCRHQGRVITLEGRNGKEDFRVCSEEPDPLLVPGEKSSFGGLKIWLPDSELDAHSNFGIKRIIHLILANVPRDTANPYENDYWRFFGPEPADFVMKREKLKMLFCAPLANITRAGLVELGVQSNIAFELDEEGHYHVQPEFCLNPLEELRIRERHIEWNVDPRRGWERFQMGIRLGGYRGKEPGKTLIILRGLDTGDIIKTKEEALILEEASESPGKRAACMAMLKQRAGELRAKFGDLLWQDERAA